MKYMHVMFFPSSLGATKVSVPELQLQSFQNYLGIQVILPKSKGGLTLQR